MGFNSLCINGKSVKDISLNGKVFWKKQTEEFTGLKLTAEQAGSTVSFGNSSPAVAALFEYSTDGATWNDYTELDTITLVNVGDFVCFRNKGDVDALSTVRKQRMFTMTGKIAASGNVMSLLHNDFSQTTSMANYAFYFLFKGCASLTSAPELPATTLADYCYSCMFRYCTSLTAAPALPATTAVDYCYYYMFDGCTSLVSPPVLPATTLATGCYSGMFYGCSALTAAPVLPATTLVSGCYSNMFRGCTAMTQPPTLQAPTLAASCYATMFRGCTSLTAAPALPATTLASTCYSNMFRDCSSLTSAPVLPATTLATNCYNYMFYNCSALKISENGGVGTKILDVPSGTASATSWNASMFSGTGGTFTGAPAIGTPYYCYS